MLVKYLLWKLIPAPKMCNKFYLLPYATKQDCACGASITLSKCIHECTDAYIKAAPTFAHVLCDYIDGLLGHHGVQLHQLIVSELLHDLSFLQEGLR